MSRAVQYDLISLAHYQILRESTITHWQSMKLLHFVLIMGGPAWAEVIGLLSGNSFIRYFSIESTQEMLDEWRPLLCPFDETMGKGIAYMELFLPTLIPPEHHQFGFKLVRIFPISFRIFCICILHPFHLL